MPPLLLSWEAAADGSENVLQEARGARVVSIFTFRRLDRRRSCLVWMEWVRQCISVIAFHVIIRAFRSAKSCRKVDGSRSSGDGGGNDQQKLSFCSVPFTLERCVCLCVWRACVYVCIEIGKAPTWRLYLVLPRPRVISCIKASRINFTRIVQSQPSR